MASGPRISLFKRSSVWLVRSYAGVILPKVSFLRSRESVRLLGVAVEKKVGNK